MKTMYNVNEVIDKIKEGRPLIFAGDEKVIKQLPAGNWIGGSIPYFISENGGKFTQDEVYVTEFPEFVQNVSVKVYDDSNIKDVYSNLADNEFGLIIIPATSPTHISFAVNAPTFENFVSRPLIGWISGVFLEDLGKVSPKVFYCKENKWFYQQEFFITFSGAPVDAIP